MIKTSGNRKSIGNLKNDLQQFVKEVQEKVMEDVSKEAKDNTPVATGRARRGWKKRNLDVVNNVDYIEKLDQGSSRQSPKGIGKPTLDTINSNFKKGKYNE
jgi:hypothetical protein